MADKREERLLSLTKTEIAKLLLDSVKGEHDLGDQTTLEIKILKSLADKNIQLFESHVLDSPITAMDYRFYVKNMSEVLDGQNIGSKASKLATIIHKCLHPNAYEVQSRLGSSFKGKLKTLKTATLGSSDDKSGIMQAKAQDQIKKAVKHKTNSVYKKLGRKARANNLKGKIAGGLLGMVGLEAFDDKVQDWVEKRDKKKFHTEDKLMEMIEEKENEEREQLEKLTNEIGSKRDLMEKLNDKDSEVARISKTLLERLDLDTKQLKEYVDDRDSSKFLENAINSQLEISDELREKIRKNLDDDDILNSKDDKKKLDKDKNPKDEKKNIEDFLKNQERDEFNSDFKSFSDRIIDSFQPRALEETSEVLTQNAEIVSNTLPAISSNTETTIENMSKVDHSLDQGFLSLTRKVGAVEEGTDRIASLLEKQISLQRKMMDNNSKSVSKTSEEDKDEDEAGLDDVLDFFDGGDRKGRKGGKGKKGGKVKGAKGGKLGKLASKVLSPVGKLASSATPFLSSGAKLLGKAALPAAALMSAYEAYEGFDEEKANQLGFDGKTTKGKTNSSISSVLSGLTFGLVGEDTIASGLHLQDELQDSIVNALGGKDSPIGAIVDKIVNPIDSVLDGFDSISSWFSDDKEKKEEEIKQQPQPVNPVLPLKAQEEPKKIDEKELLDKVFTAAEQLNPVEQFKNIADHMFDSPGAKQVWDKLTDKDNLFDSIMNPVGSIFSGLSNSFMSFFSSKSDTTAQPSNYPSINYGSGGVTAPNIGQYGGSAVGDGDIDKVNASANMGDVKALLDYGMSFIGKCSYQMGAKDPTSGRCDCSGFVKFLYTRVWGVKGMPDGAAYQFTWNKGRVINSLEELKPGDIYFMNSPAAHAAGRPLGISHVGIYAGGGNLLHCSSKKGVNLMPLNDYYKKWFVGAKRLTEEGGSMGVTSPTAENSPTMTMPASNPMAATGGVMPVGGMTGGLTDPNNPNSIGVGDAALSVGNVSAIPYSNLSNANADKNASKSALAARDAFIKNSLESGVSTSDIAVMLGQLDHESGGFKSLHENLNYSSASRIQEMFGKTLREQGVDPRSLVNNPQALANVVYGRKNGNRGGSDGWNYRGRGLVQLTGRSNYEQASKALGIDLVNNPDLAADPEVAAKVAAWWHKSKVGYGVDVATATRKINGKKMAGLNDRIAKTQGWLNGRLDTEIARINGKKDIKNTEPVEGQVEQSLATNTQPVAPQVQVPGIASSFVDERRAMPLPMVQADVQSLPVTESVKVPPTRSQELQQQANMMSSIMTPMFNPMSSNSGQGAPSPDQAIKWKDWIEDSSLLSLQKFINGGLG